MSLYRRITESALSLTPRDNGPWEYKRPGLAAEHSAIPPEHILAVVRWQKNQIPERLRANRYSGSLVTDIRDALRLYAPGDYSKLTANFGAHAVRTALNKLVNEKRLEAADGGRFREPLVGVEKASADAIQKRQQQADALVSRAKKALGSNFVAATQQGKNLRLTVLIDLDDPDAAKKIEQLA